MTRIINPMDGAHYDWQSDSMRIGLTGTDTDGLLTFIEDRLKPGFKLALHLHRTHSETFYVLEGNVTFALGSDTVQAAPGTIIHIPPNTPHEVSCAEGGKMLTLVSPAGIDSAMRAYAAMTPEQAADPAANQAIADQYDIVDLAQPPIPALLKWDDYLTANNAEALIALFAGQPSINTPLTGQVSGSAAFRQFVAAQSAWFAAHNVKSHFVNLVVSQARIVLELSSDITLNGDTFDLPNVLVADRSPDQSDKIAAVRIYHSTWPLNGKHLIREPLLSAPAEPLHEPAIIQSYMAALSEPNLALLESTFLPDAYVREPSGSRYKHVGVAGRAEFYRAMEKGGVILHHCTATYNGYSFAVEYICDEWAKVKFPGQAGLAVYDITDGKLSAARIYDDVAPPDEQ